MIVKKSPLELISFHLLESNFEFILPKEEEVNPIDLFNSYPIDIDFTHQKVNGNKSHIQVFVEIKINEPKEIAGYSFKVTGMGRFSLDETDLEEIAVTNLRFYSSLNMVINNLRNIIAQQSAFAPMGTYLLPPIDMQDMMMKKAKAKKKT